MKLDKDFNLIIGLRIREIREVLQMTREEFSEKCDISSSFLAAIEGGQNAITSKTLYKICTAFDISADYIIRGKSDDFEMDMILEMLNTLDKRSREHALLMLREYIQAIIEIKKN